MAPTMIAVFLALACVLAGVALLHGLVALVFLRARLAPPGVDVPEPLPLAVAIPTRNEGEGAVRALRSVLGQDYPGDVTVHLLVADRDDTALPCLARAFPQADLTGAEDEVVLWSEPGRVAVVGFTGRSPKHHHLNWLVERTSCPLVAILDGDHEAFPDWLRRSVAVMRESSADVVQARRVPISREGLTALWDSLHQHVGCEVLNVAFSALGLPVFFTGTTAVLKTEVLRQFPFRERLTEDTDLSYRLLLAGRSIRYNPVPGSREEVSPDLYSFLARRRRWAHGHTEAFLQALPLASWSRLGMPSALQFLFHGVHYLWALPVLLLNACLAVLLLPQHGPADAVVATALGLVLGAWWHGTQVASGWRSGAMSLAVLSAWTVPLADVGLQVALAGVEGDPERLALPIPPEVTALAVLGLTAPLALLFVGMARYRWLTLRRAGAVLLSYPLAFLLDIAGVALGLSDFLARRRTWQEISRPQGMSPESVSGTFAEVTRMRASRRMVALVLGVVVAIGVLVAMPTRRIPLVGAATETLEWDVHPWIRPPAHAKGPVASYVPATSGKRTGRFGPPEVLDPGYWEPLADTFPCNLAMFAPENVVFREGGGLSLWLRSEARGDRAFTAASVATRKDSGVQHLYGRFEADLKPPKRDGTLTALFLYRFDPWQEIDLEFLGRDTTKVMANVYYNAGEEGDPFNYGHRGTPVLVDLGFDAAADFHRYAIEWDPNEIRWFVDDRLIHARSSGHPTPVPHLPMRLFVNLWPNCSEELVGSVAPSTLPAAAEVRSVRVSPWHPPSWGWTGVRDWRDADWMQGR